MDYKALIFHTTCDWLVLPYKLGHGDDRLSSGPRVIEALKTDKTGSPIGPVLCVSAGGIHSAVVVEGGFVYTWGGSSYGQVSCPDFYLMSGNEISCRSVFEFT